MKIVPLELYAKELQRIQSRSVEHSQEVKNKVQSILTAIRKQGEKAAHRYAVTYDGLPKSKKLLLSPSVILKQAKKCPPKVKVAINKAIKNIYAFHLKQTEKSWMIKQKDNVELGQLIRPLSRVGVYVPGGEGIYPSSLMMNVIPAKIAGVKEIVVTTPCGENIHPSIAYVLTKLVLTEVYQLGGAQAVGLLAYGSSKIKSVDKIVGPGNQFVALAKKEVYGKVSIDMIAGPSEILVICDDSSNPDWVAADLLSQAEHGSGWEAAICIVDSMDHALRIQNMMKEQLSKSPKKEILKTALRRFGRIFVVPSLEKAVSLANEIAPEHLEIMTRNNNKYIPLIENAGAIFDGSYSAESVGDYFAGPNHVLPTTGSARFFSPLGVYDFYKRTNYINYSREAMISQGKHIVNLAEAEGFWHHAEAIKKRL